MNEATPSPNMARCIYGYALVVVSFIAFSSYLIWAFTPQYIIEALGLSYFLPSKYWAICIPFFCCFIIIIFTVFIYPAIICMKTNPFDSINNIKDSYTVHNKQKRRCPGAIPTVGDLAIEDVCSVLYYDKNWKDGLQEIWQPDEDEDDLIKT